jgi:hypothetical protein
MAAPSVLMEADARNRGRILRAAGRMSFTAESAFQGREGIMARVGPTGDGRATLFRTLRGNQAAIIPMSSSFQMKRRPLGAHVQSTTLKIKMIKIP